jgi:diacylglycerol cholinephosphotransferase
VLQELLKRCPDHFRGSLSPQIPLWVAPNLLTGVGFLVNFATVLPLLLLDTNLEGVAPSWLYVAAAAGFFIYQSLDAIDGKQARRTGSANQLGELFDHGCDAVSLFLILMSGASAIGIHDYPISLLVFVVLLNQVNFVYHWQTFVCGTLHFNLFDVTEGEFTSIGLLLVRGLFGLQLWDIELPVVNIRLKMVLVSVVLCFSFLNLLQPFLGILTRGVGKNGTTVANTSVLSPLVTMMILAPVPFLYYSFSPSPLRSHSLLFISATTLPAVKATIIMILSSMTKTPYPLLDPLHLAPWFTLLNVLVGSPISEIPLLFVVTVWEVVDIAVFCVTVCLQVANFLQVPIFTLPPNATPPTSHITMTTSKHPHS